MSAIKLVSYKQKESKKDGRDFFYGMKPFDVVLNCEKHGIQNTVCMCFDKNNIESLKCPICEEEDEKAQEKAQSDSRLLIKYTGSGIEDEFIYKTFDDFKCVSQSQKEALNAVKQLCNKNPRYKKVILLGKNGTGKTMLASIAVKELGGRIISMFEISALIRESYTKFAEKSEMTILKELISLPFLVIDEVGRVKQSDATQDWLFYILSKRHSRKLPFLLISNAHTKSRCPDGGCEYCFESLLNDGILSRLSQDSYIVSLDDAPDWRMKTGA